MLCFLSRRVKLPSSHLTPPFRTSSFSPLLTAVNSGYLNPHLSPTPPLTRLIQPQMSLSTASVPSEADPFAGRIPVKVLSAEENAAIDRFKEFLRIPSVTADVPKGVHEQIRAFLEAECKDIGLEFTSHEFTPGYPIFIATWRGTDPSLPSILLNSHYDVVPVAPSLWSFPPFGATELPNGDIVARGAQDMKCVCMQHIEAVRRLKAGASLKGGAPLRTVHLALMPDEEMGGALGMGKWVASPEFAALNVGFALDEGIASETGTATVFYGERAVWWLRLLATGNTGHASRFIENTAVEKLLKTVSKFQAYRDEQEAVLGGKHVGCKHATAKKLGDVVTLNLTMLRAGMTLDGGETYSYNVIPPEAHAGFDIRIPPHVDLNEFEELVESWLEPGVTHSFVVKTAVNNKTSTDEGENPYWGVLQRACAKGGMPLDPQVFPAATDGRYLRNVANLPVIGFSPIVHQPILLHENDEKLNKFTYVKGIEVFEEIVNDLAHMPATATASASASASTASAAAEGKSE